MNSSDTRISSYLDTLSRLTADLDPATRDEVLAGVREHLDATLAEHPDDPGAVDAALLRLGPPERVAAEARADFRVDGSSPAASPASATAAVTSPPTPSPGHHGRAMVAGLSSLALLGLPVTAALASRVAWELAAESDASGWQVSVGPFVAHSSETLAVLPLLVAPWLVTVVLAVLGRELRRPTRTILVLLGPATCLAVLVSSSPGRSSVRGHADLAPVPRPRPHGDRPHRPEGVARDPALTRRHFRVGCPGGRQDSHLSTRLEKEGRRGPAGREGRAGRRSEGADDVLDAVLGVAEEHLRVLPEEQRVLHARVPGRHRALEDDDLTGLPDPDDGHPGDR